MFTEIVLGGLGVASLIRGLRKRQRPAEAEADQVQIVRAGGPGSPGAGAIGVQSPLAPLAPVRGCQRCGPIIPTEPVLAPASPPTVFASPTTVQTFLAPEPTDFSFRRGIYYL